MKYTAIRHADRAPHAQQQQKSNRFAVKGGGRTAVEEGELEPPEESGEGVANRRKTRCGA